jgi:CheY-like chemotaxis protein/HPt (histidine-containing phosphotransfer) domain-containing protein
MSVRILVVEDDELSREVLALLLQREGYEVESVDSGDAALLHLQTMRPLPGVVLTDLQMPGTTGDALARQLRGLCGTGTLLLGMSASESEGGRGREFDGFLLKPFGMEALAEVIAGGRSGVGNDANGTGGGVLNWVVYEKLAGSMPQSRLEQLYSLCLTDATSRIATMRRAASDGDDGAYRKGAHAIKGGCGMVGAIELQSLATSMEERGLCDDHIASLDEFMLACERLRRILVAHKIKHNRANGLSGETRNEGSNEEV